MRRTWVICLLLLPVAAVIAGASEDDTQALIQLDKEWGSAGRAEAVAAVRRLIADDVIAVSGEGVATKADMLAEAESDEGPTSPYVADQYDVRFLDENTAVMTHRAGEPEPHWSLHVWVKRDGAWRVVASMSTPIAD